MTKLSDINKVLNESDDKLRTISDVVSDTRAITKQNVVNTNLVASRIGRWIEGEKSKGGDLLEARRKADRVKNATVVASRGALNPTATTFTGGLLEGAMTASGLSAISGFASGVIGSIFGNKALSLNLAARAGTLLGRGAIYSTLAAGVSIFGEDILTKFLNDLDPDDVTFTDEQKADIASRAGDGLQAGFISRIFTKNKWVNMAAFVGGAFGDEIYAQFENTFGKDGLKDVKNPFGIGPDTLDFTQGPLKEAMIMAVPLLAASLLRVAGKALITRLAIPLTAGVAVGILKSIGWTGLANLLDKPPVPPGSGVDTPAMGGPRRGSAGGNKIQQAIRRVAGLSDETLAALRAAGYEVNAAGRLYEVGTGRLQSLAQINNLVDQIKSPGLISRGLTALGRSSIGQKTASAFSYLANSWVGKTGRFLGKWALPASVALEGGLGYFDPEMKAVGMNGLERIASGVTSGVLGQTIGDTGAWLYEKGAGALGYDVDVADISEAMRRGSIIAHKDGGIPLMAMIKTWANDQAGLDPYYGTSMQQSIMGRYDPSTYVAPTGRTGLDHIEEMAGINTAIPYSSLLDQLNNGTFLGGPTVTISPTTTYGGSIINNNGYVLGDPAPTDNANGGSNFGFIGR